MGATMPNAIRRISRDYLNDPEEVTVKSETRTNTNITQRYLFTAHRNKLDAITRILEVTEFEAMIVFVRTKNETEELAEKLRARGFSAAAINGDIAQQQRERTVVSFTATGEVREFQLRIRFRFRLRTPEGRELLPMSEIVRQIDQSYSESAALSKEQEALMLYQNLQSDIVQQVMRRLATVKT